MYLVVEKMTRLLSYVCSFCKNHYQYKLKNKLYQKSKLMIYQSFFKLSFKVWRYNNNLFMRYSYHTTSYSLDLCNGDLQTTTALFTCNFTQGWLNYYWLVASFGLPFYMGKWSVCWRFAFSRILWREVYCLYIVYTVLVVAFAYISIPFSLILLLLVYLYLDRYVC